MKRIVKLTGAALGILGGIISLAVAGLAAPKVTPTQAGSVLPDPAKTNSGQPDTGRAQPRNDPTNNDLGLHYSSGGWGFFPAKRPDPNLPCVLLVGDSVMNGYRAEVSRLLSGKANLDAWATPQYLAHEYLLSDLAKVLNRGPYAVIHFNNGLHDWTEAHIPPGQYEPLMEHYVATYLSNAPASKLIWASSTPLTVKGAKTIDPTNNPVVLRHNEIAAQVATAHAIPINDLYTLGTGHLSLTRGDQFHWTAEGARLMAEQVSRHILAVLVSVQSPQDVKPAATNSSGP